MDFAFLGDLPQLTEENDGTLRNGFLSITGGRYRIIIGSGGNPATVVNEGNCSGSTNAGDFCANLKACNDSSNKHCSNGGVCIVKVNSGVNILK